MKKIFNSGTDAIYNIFMTLNTVNLNSENYYPNRWRR